MAGDDQMNSDAVVRRTRRRAVVLWGRLAHVYTRFLEAQTRCLRTWDLTFMEFDILAHIVNNEGCTQTELAERVLVTQGNITYHLNKLVQRGLVERRAEWRSNHLYLTSEGRRLFDEVAPRQEALLVTHLSVLTVEQQELLLAQLRLLEKQRWI